MTAKADGNRGACAFAAGGDYIARRGGEQGLYDVDGKAVMDLRQSAGDVKPGRRRLKSSTGTDWPCLLWRAVA